MKRLPSRCDLQIWVCVNERGPRDPLPSCGLAAGMEIYQQIRALAAEIGRSEGRVLWVNRTLCQGFCHKDGVTLRLEPGAVILQAVGAADLPAVATEIKGLLGKAKN